MASEDLELNITAKVDGAEDVRDLKRELDALDGESADVTVDVDTGGATRDLAEVDSAVEDVGTTTSRVTVDDLLDPSLIGDVNQRLDAVQSDLDGLAAKDVGGQPLGGLQQGLADTLGQVEQVTGEASTMGQAFVGASSIAQSALGAAGLAGAATGVGAALAGVGLAIGVISAAFGRMSKASEAAKKRVEAWRKALDDAGKDGASSLDVVNDRVRELVEGSTDLVDAMGKFGVTGGDLASTLNGEVAPSVTKVNDFLKRYEEAMARSGATSTRTGENLSQLAASMGLTEGELSDLRESAGRLVGTLEDEGAAFGDASADSQAARDALSDLTDSTEDAADATERLSDAYDLLSGALDVQEQTLAVRDAFAEVATAQMEAHTAAGQYGASSEEAAQASRDAQGAVLGLERTVLSYAQSLGNIPPEVVSEVLADIEDGSITTADQVLQRLADAPRVADVKANPTNVTQADAAIDAVASQQRIAAIYADANTDDATRELLKLTASRIVKIYTDVVGSSGGGGTNLPGQFFAVPPAGRAATAPMLMAAPVTTVTPRVVAGPTVTVNVRAGVIGNRDDVTRGVIAAIKRGQRLVGARGWSS